MRIVQYVTPIAELCIFLATPSQEKQIQITTARAKNFSPWKEKTWRLTD